MEHLEIDIVEAENISVTIQDSPKFIVRLLRAMSCTESSAHVCFYCAAADLITEALVEKEQQERLNSIDFDKYHVQNLLERLRSASYGDGMQRVHDLFDDVTIEIEKLYRSL